MAEVAGETLRCSACRLETYTFDRARSFALYENEVVRAIVLLKFERIEPLAKWFAQQLAEIYAKDAEVLGSGYRCAGAAASRPRKRARLQPSRVAFKPLARLLRLPHQGVLLVRKRPRPAKLVLTLRGRWAAVRGAFEIRPGGQVDNRRVLLLDDVMTTGATLDACSKALRDAGAKSVVALTVARAAHNPLPGAGES
jgi:competence protein ComFC